MSFIEILFKLKNVYKQGFLSLYTHYFRIAFEDPSFFQFFQKRKYFKDVFDIQILI